MTVTETASRNEMLLAARAVGLRYVDPADPGIRRVRRGGGFGYVSATGRPVSEKSTLERIRALAIPPAWEDVWISPSPIGHIQATGRDARGRLQYRYHALWAQVRDENKYARTLQFARALPRLRRRVARDLRLRGLPRQKVVAAAVRLLEMTLIRVGNDEYARENGSFGLTTLRGRHAQVRGADLMLSFRGKGGKQHSVGLRDRRVARLVRACQELPGQRLFQYVDDDGKPQHIDSDDVNDYLREVMGPEFSAKDFRTWAGTVLAIRALQDIEEAPNRRAAVNAAVREVAGQLGNTVAVCRRCYIHPDVIESYIDGSLAAAVAAVERKPTAARGMSGLRADERLVLAVLKRRVAAARGRPARAARRTAKRAA